jgi:O-methyltransferase
MVASVKRGIKSVARRFGYEITPIHPPEPDLFSVELTSEDAKYYTRWSTPYPLFTPWVGHPDFQQIYEGAAPYTTLPPDRCYTLISFARYAAFLRGDFAECGVYKGGTALMLCRIMKKHGKRIYLFDSFEGLPEPDEKKDVYFQKGEYAASAEAVKQLLTEFDDLVDIRQGWIPQAFSGLEDNHYTFVHIDVDLYQSNLDCCRYFYPRLVAGGVLLFDEYCETVAHGEKVAVDEYFADKPEFPIALPTGQALVLKSPVIGNSKRRRAPVLDKVPPAEPHRHRPKSKRADSTRQRSQKHAR